MGGHLKNTKLLQQIATKLKALREKNGLTQEDVYNDTGIHISRIETSRGNITVSTLSSLCDYFEIKLSDFFKEIT
ncbi:XRE family transcriptional regulator [Aquimarina sp. BL5]|uniref:helix-turn-helix domain-containing protein n=1 Tax=unclassified Aquimarina TaxID=2627091 RepID=UPI000D69AFF3|nr:MULTISPECIES: helix-turn-helix transcriptional regulator [unclassified Aquimarina]AXT49683.1 XRE family transcriptional regulator [Aquimarina sp. BL5]RKN00482.1 XRE family transcriptional regulator [Aquimarina sp. BL5]